MRIKYKPTIKHTARQELPNGGCIIYNVFTDDEILLEVKRYHSMWDNYPIVYYEAILK